MTTRQIITVTVNNLDPFGQGVTRHQGKVLFVGGVLPQKQAEMVLVEDKKQYARTQVKRRPADSPQRQAPRCPHFGVCGGYQQQHAGVTLQQQSKRTTLVRLTRREVDEIIAGVPWGYRHHTRLSLNHQPKTQQLQTGFRQANAKTVVDVVQYPVLAPRLEVLLPTVRGCLSAPGALHHLGHVELTQAGNGPLMVLRHTVALPAGDREKLERFSQTRGLSLYLTPQNEILEHIHGETPQYTSDGLRLVFSPRDFIQVNDGVSQQMVRTALERLDLQPEDRVLDLFCGMSDFTLPLATRTAHVVGVEGMPALVEREQGDAALNGLSSVTFFHENLKEDVTHQAWVKHSFNKVLLDPARVGTPGVMPHIIKLAPRRVVYVSCNPMTLARDSEALLQTGYQIQRLAMLDMFPHTGHLELMVLFRRRPTQGHSQRHRRATLAVDAGATCRMTCRKLRLANFGKPVP